jgi:hypothetical protein
MRSQKNIQTTLARLARVEQRFMLDYFLAPVVRNHSVRVKIAGVMCEMSVDPPDFAGWGIFLPISHKQAMLDRRATLSQRRRYLELFPAVRLIVCHHDSQMTLAIPANRSDTRFQIDGVVDVNLAEEVATFDSVIARFDGRQFWFDQIDPSADPSIAAYLRQAIVAMTGPKLVERRGLSSVQFEIYERMHRAARQEAEQHRQDESRDRIRDALEHGGASLRDCAEQGDAYRVTYDVGGSRHVSVVRKNDLTVLSAGICLSGMDRQFDLASMVGVLSEARAVGHRW